MKRGSAMRFMVLVLLAGLLPSLAAAQSRYGVVRGQGEPAQALVGELRALIEEASRARAADPLFLRDLRALASRYDKPWPQRLVFDDFGDGDHARNPAWVVASGAFSVQPYRGLESRAGATATGGAGEGDRQPTAQELAVGILAGILAGQLGDSSDQEADQPARPAPPTAAAEISLPERVTNAFALTAEVSAPDPSGDLEFVVFQGTRRDAGYRLVVSPAQSITLVRFSPRGTFVVERVRGSVALNDRASHVLEWTRTRDGAMVVRIDGAEQMTAADAFFRDDFDGFAWINRGGTYRLVSLAIDGDA